MKITPEHFEHMKMPPHFPCSRATVKLREMSEPYNRARRFVWKFAQQIEVEGREDEGPMWSVWYRGYQHAEHDLKDLVISVSEMMGAKQ